MDDDLEIHVNITPKDDVLKSLGISVADFEAALADALETLDSHDEASEELGIEDAPVIVKGVAYRIEDLASIEFSDDADQLDDSSEHDR